MNEARDPYQRIYPSHRYPVYAAGGMVCCSSPQAASAGLDMLRRGGNAVDAAVAAAGALTVAEMAVVGERVAVAVLRGHYRDHV